MVAVITSEGLGLFNSQSAGASSGQNSLGQANTHVFVNAATGNLIVRRTDQVLANQGIDNRVSRTYNSLGQFSDGQLYGGTFRFSFNQRLINIPITINGLNTTITRISDDGHETVFQYDQQLDLYVSTDGGGGHDTLEYNNGQWIWTEGSSKVKEYYHQYNGEYRLDSIEDSESRITKLVYDNELLTRIIDAADLNAIDFKSSHSQIIELNYKQALQSTGNLLTGITTITPSDFEAQTQTQVFYTYDDNDRLSKVEIDLTPEIVSDNTVNNYVIGYSYHGSTQQLASIRQSDGSTMSFDYAGDRIARIMTGEGSERQITRYEYYDDIRTTKILQQLSNGSTYISEVKYDADGKLLQLISPPDISGSQHISTYYYDEDDNLKEVIDPRGNKSKFEYDDNGNQTRQDQLDSSDALLQRIERQFGDKNQLLAEILYTGDSNYLMTRYVYDDQLRIRFVIDADGSVTETVYGDVSNDRYNTRTITTYDYLNSRFLDELNNPNATASAFALTVLKNWANNSNAQDVRKTVTQLDFRGQVYSISTYDELSKQASQGQTQYFLYDQEGQLLKTVDPRGNAPSQAYDQSPYDTLFSYDGMGRLVATNDANNVMTQTYFLDSQQKIVTTTAKQESNGTIRTSDESVQTTTVFDSSGNIVSIEQLAPNDTKIAANTTENFYDSRGLLRATRNTSGIFSHFLYDQQNRLIASMDGSGTLSTNIYDENDNIIASTVYADAILASFITQLNNQARNKNFINSLPNIILSNWLSNLRGDPVVGEGVDNPNNRTAIFVYDDANRLRFSIDPEGYFTENVFDTAGRITETIQHGKKFPGFVELLSINTKSISSTINAAVDPLQTFNPLQQAIYDILGGDQQAFELLSQMQFGTYDYSQLASQQTQAVEVITGDLIISGATVDSNPTVRWPVSSRPDNTTVWFLYRATGSNQYQTASIQLDTDNNQFVAQLPAVTEGQYDYRILYTNNQAETIRLSEGTINIADSQTFQEPIVFTTLAVASKDLSTANALLSGDGWQGSTGLKGSQGVRGPSGSQNINANTGINTFVGSGESYLAPAGSGENVIHWIARVDGDVTYKVYARWQAGVNRASNAPYTIFHLDEWGQPTVSTIRVNQQQSNNEWVLLGEFRFAEGETQIILSNDADGFISADAVRLQAQEKTVAESVVIDDSEADVTGPWWKESDRYDGYIGENYQIAPRGWKHNAITWQTELDNTREYEVLVRLFHQKGLAKKQRYHVYHLNQYGQETVSKVTVKNRHRDPNGEWVSLGTFYFGKQGKVVLDNKKQHGWMMADALRFDPKETATIVLDDQQATLQGDAWYDNPWYARWMGYVGKGYRIAEGGDGSSTATWQQSVSDEQEYSVYARWPVYRSRTTEAPFTIKYTDANGELQQDTVRVNMRDYRDHNDWVYLGSYHFSTGLAEITLSNDAQGTVAADAIKLQPIKIEEKILDDRDANLKGFWYGNNRRLNDYYGKGYRVAPPAGKQHKHGWRHHYNKGISTAEWTTSVSNKTTYKVYARWPTHKNRATNAPFTIRHLDENGQPTSSTIIVDMTDTSHRQQWVLLGEFRFASGETTITLSNNNVDGFIAADAIKLTPQAMDAVGDAIVDDKQANIVGDGWSKRNYRGVPGYFGTGYRVSKAQKAGEEKSTATWTHQTQAADYRIYARWTSYKTRATDAPFTIIHLDENGQSTETTVRVNMQDKTLHGEWVYLGTYQFSEGQAKVILSNDANGTVAADAVRFDYVSIDDATIDKGQADLSGSWETLNRQLGENPSDVMISPGNKGPQGPQAVLTDPDAVLSPIQGEYYVATAGSGDSQVQWQAPVGSGHYQLYARWVAGSNNATNAPYTIHHADGDTVVRLNQQQRGDQWILLGSYQFNNGNAVVTLSNEANGLVVAESLRLTSATSAATAQVDPSQWIDTVETVDGGSIVGFIPLELVDVIKEVKATVYDEIGKRTSEAITNPRLIREQTGEYNGEVNLSMDGSLADGKYQVVIDISYLDDRADTSQTVDYQILDQQGKQYQAFAWDLAAYALASTDTVIFSYRPLGSQAPMTSRVVEKQQDEGQYYLMLGEDLNPIDYEYRIEYRNEHSRLLAYTDGVFEGALESDQRIDLSVNTIQAETSDANEGSGTLVEDYLNITDDTAEDYVDIQQLYYVSTIVRDNVSGLVVNYDPNQDELPVRTYVDPQQLIRGNPSTHINLSVGEPLADGNYQVEAALHFLDGSTAIRDPFVHQVGLQAVDTLWEQRAPAKTAEQMIEEWLQANKGSQGQAGPTGNSGINGPVAPVQEAPDREVRNFYDDKGLLIGVLDAENYLSTFQYNGSGDVIEVIAYGKQQPALRDATRAEAQSYIKETNDNNILDQAISSGDASGDQRTITLYNGRGQVEAVIDPLGFVTYNQYDLVGNVVKTGQYHTPILTTDLNLLGDISLLRLQQLLPYINKIPASLNAIVNISGSKVENRDNTVKIESVRTYNHLNQLQTESTLHYDDPDQQELDATTIGAETLYVYNKSGQVLEVKNGDRVSHIEYDAFGRQVAEISPLLVDDSSNNKISHEYDDAGRRISTTDENGHTLYFYYDDSNRLRFSVNALGEISEVVYNQFSEQIETVAYGARYSDLSKLHGGLLTSDHLSDFESYNTADSISAETTYTKRGLVSTVTQGEDVARDKISSLSTYNPFGELDYVTEFIRAKVDGVELQRQRISHVEYDKRGLATTQTVFGAGQEVKTLTSYDAFGRVVNATDSLGNISAIDYKLDNIGRLITVNKNAVGTPFEIKNETVVDASGRTIITKNSLGHIATTEYEFQDDGTQLIINRFEVGSETFETRSRLNEYGEQVKVKDAEGRITTFEYDDNGNLKKTINDLLISTESVYDDGNRVIRTIGESVAGNEGIVTQFTYDAASRVTTQIIDPSGLAIQTDYEYDALGRQVKTTEYNHDVYGNAQNRVTQTIYDKNSNTLFTIVDPDGLGLATKYKTDSEGNALKVLEGTYKDGMHPERETYYQFDDLGRRISEELDGMVTTYEYDTNSNVILKTMPTGGRVAFSYDALNRVQYEITEFEMNTASVVERVYDDAGQVVKTLAFADSINITDWLNIDIDANNSFNKIHDENQVALYFYDEAGRQTHQIDALGYVSHFEYDKVGNVLSTKKYSESVGNVKSLSPSDRSVLPLSNDDSRKIYQVYDNLNRLRFTIDGEGYVTEQIYNQRSQVEKVVQWKETVSLKKHSESDLQAILSLQSNEVESKTVHDSIGRVTAVLDQEQNEEKYTLNELGNQLTLENAKSTDDKKIIWEYIYDNAGRLINEITPEVDITTTHHSTLKSDKQFLDISSNYDGKINQGKFPDQHGNIRQGFSIDASILQTPRKTMHGGELRSGGDVVLNYEETTFKLMKEGSIESVKTVKVDIFSYQDSNEWFQVLLENFDISDNNYYLVGDHKYEFKGNPENLMPDADAEADEPVRFSFGGEFVFELPLKLGQIGMGLEWEAPKSALNVEIYVENHSQETPQLKTVNTGISNWESSSESFALYEGQKYQGYDVIVNHINEELAINVTDVKLKSGESYQFTGIDIDGNAITGVIDAKIFNEGIINVQQGNVLVDEYENVANGEIISATNNYLDGDTVTLDDIDYIVGQSQEDMVYTVNGFESLNTQYVTAVNMGPVGPDLSATYSTEALDADWVQLNNNDRLRLEIPNVSGPDNIASIEVVVLDLNDNNREVGRKSYGGYLPGNVSIDLDVGNDTSYGLGQHQYKAVYTGRLEDSNSTTPMGNKTIRVNAEPSGLNRFEVNVNKFKTENVSFNQLYPFVIYQPKIRYTEFINVDRNAIVDTQLSKVDDGLWDSTSQHILSTSILDTRSNIADGDTIIVDGVEYVVGYHNQQLVSVIPTGEKVVQLILPSDMQGDMEGVSFAARFHSSSSTMPEETPLLLSLPVPRDNGNQQPPNINWLNQPYDGFSYRVKDLNGTVLAGGRAISGTEITLPLSFINGADFTGNVAFVVEYFGLPSVAANNLFDSQYFITDYHVSINGTVEDIQEYKYLISVDNIIDGYDNLPTQMVFLDAGNSTQKMPSPNSPQPVQIATLDDGTPVYRLYQYQHVSRNPSNYNVDRVHGGQVQPPITVTVPAGGDPGYSIGDVFLGYSPHGEALYRHTLSVEKTGTELLATRESFSNGTHGWENYSNQIQIPNNQDYTTRSYELDYDDSHRHPSEQYNINVPAQDGTAISVTHGQVIPFVADGHVFDELQSPYTIDGELEFRLNEVGSGANIIGAVPGYNFNYHQIDSGEISISGDPASSWKLVDEQNWENIGTQIASGKTFTNKENLSNGDRVKLPNGNTYIIGLSGSLLTTAVATGQKKGVFNNGAVITYEQHIVVTDVSNNLNDKTKALINKISPNGLATSEPTKVPSLLLQTYPDGNRQYRHYDYMDAKRINLTYQRDTSLGYGPPDIAIITLPVGVDHGITPGVKEIDVTENGLSIHEKITITQQNNDGNEPITRTVSDGWSGWKNSGNVIELATSLGEPLNLIHVNHSDQPYSINFSDDLSSGSSAAFEGVGVDGAVINGDVEVDYFSIGNGVIYDSRDFYSVGYETLLTGDYISNSAVPPKVGDVIELNGKNYTMGVGEYDSEVYLPGSVQYLPTEVVTATYAGSSNPGGMPELSASYSSGNSVQKPVSIRWQNNNEVVLTIPEVDQDPEITPAYVELRDFNSNLIATSRSDWSGTLRWLVSNPESFKSQELNIIYFGFDREPNSSPRPAERLNVSITALNEFYYDVVVKKRIKQNVNVAGQSKSVWTKNLETLVDKRITTDSNAPPSDGDVVTVDGKQYIVGGTNYDDVYDLSKGTGFYTAPTQRVSVISDGEPVPSNQYPVLSATSDGQSLHAAWDGTKLSFRIPAVAIGNADQEARRSWTLYEGGNASGIPIASGLETDRDVIIGRDLISIDIGSPRDFIGTRTYSVRYIDEPIDVAYTPRSVVKKITVTGTKAVGYKFKVKVEERDEARLENIEIPTTQWQPRYRHTEFIEVQEQPPATPPNLSASASGSFLNAEWQSNGINLKIPTLPEKVKREYVPAGAEVFDSNNVSVGDTNAWGGNVLIRVDDPSAYSIGNHDYTVKYYGIPPAGSNRVVQEINVRIQATTSNNASITYTIKTYTERYRTDSATTYLDEYALRFYNEVYEEVIEPPSPPSNGDVITLNGKQYVVGYSNPKENVQTVGVPQLLPTQHVTVAPVGIFDGVLYEFPVYSTNRQQQEIELLGGGTNVVWLESWAGNRTNIGSYFSKVNIPPKEGTELVFKGVGYRIGYDKIDDVYSEVSAVALATSPIRRVIVDPAERTETVFSSLTHYYKVTVDERDEAGVPQNIPTTMYQPQVRVTNFDDRDTTVNRDIYEITYNDDEYNTIEQLHYIDQYALKTTEESYKEEVTISQPVPEGLLKLDLTKNGDTYSGSLHEGIPENYDYFIKYDLNGESYTEQGSIDALMPLHSQLISSGTETTQDGLQLIKKTASEIQYDSLGNVVRRIEGLMQETEGVYNNRLSRTTDYEYDEAGRQQVTILSNSYGVTEADGERSETFYSDAGLAVYHQDYLGNENYKAYDLAGRLIYEIDAESYLTEYGYDVFGNQETLIRYAKAISIAATVTEDQKKAGLSIAQIDSYKIIDANNDRTIVTKYDQLNRKIKESHTDDRGIEYLDVTETKADIRSQLVVETASPITAYEYNAYGEIEEQWVYTNENIDDSLVAYFTYNDRGLLISQTDANNNETTFTYDFAGRQLTIFEEDDSETNGQLNSRLTEVVYDDLGRLTEQNLNGDLIVANEYDALGNVINTTDKAGNTTHMYYDVLGRTTHTVEPKRELVLKGVLQSPVTSFKYDIHNNVVETVRFSKSYTGSINKVIPPVIASSSDDKKEYLTYNVQGQQTQFISVDGVHYTRQYDAYGNIKKESSEMLMDGELVSVENHFEYDKLGQQVAHKQNYRAAIDDIDDEITETHTVYNAFGEVTARGVGAINRTQTDLSDFQEHYTYDRAGRLIKTNQTDGVYKQYAYSLTGYQTAQLVGLNSQFDIENSGLSKLIEDYAKSVSDGNHIGTEGLRITLNVNDALGRVEQQHAPVMARRNDATGSITQVLKPVHSYVYDRWDNQLQMSTSDNNSSVLNLEYDDFNRVVNEFRSNVTFYNEQGQSSVDLSDTTTTTKIAYDDYDNVISLIDANGHETRSLYNRAGQLLQKIDATGVKRTSFLDIFGRQKVNIIGGENVSDVDAVTMRYEYDQGDRIIRQTVADRVTRYRYDANGQRTHEIIERGDTKPALVTEHVYNQRGDLLESRLPMYNENVKVKHLDLNGFDIDSINQDGEHALYSTKHRYDAVGNKLETIDGNGRNMSMSYYHEGFFRRIETKNDLAGRLVRYEYNDQTGELKKETISNSEVINKPTKEYSYYENGLLRTIQKKSHISKYERNDPNDKKSINEITGNLINTAKFDYDIHGNRIKESMDTRKSYDDSTVPGSPIVKQNLIATYDSLNRVSTVRDTREGKTLELTYYYDAMNNRRAILGRNAKKFDYWYTYDAANRVEKSQGSLGHNGVELSEGKGRKLSYYSDTGRLMKMATHKETPYNPPNRDIPYEKFPQSGIIIKRTEEMYDYNSYGELEKTTRKKFETLNDMEDDMTFHSENFREYDMAGRLIDEWTNTFNTLSLNDNEMHLTEKHTLKYNDNSWQLSDSVDKRNSSTTNDMLSSTLVSYSGSPNLGYDGVGNLYGYSVNNTDYPAKQGIDKQTRYSIEYRNTYDYFDSYKESTRYGRPTSGTIVDTLRPGTSYSYYDAWGNLGKWIDSPNDGVSSNDVVTYDVNHEGKILQRTILSSGGPESDEKESPIMFYYYLNGESLGHADSEFKEFNFDVQFSPLTEISNIPNQYVVNAGETLQSIAKKLYGDAALWYLIADANGIANSDNVLKGTMLRIPDAQGMLHNSSDVYKPYSPGKIIGDTSPTLPVAPFFVPKGKCGGFSQIIVNIVKAVVTAIAASLGAPYPLQQLLANAAEQQAEKWVGLREHFDSDELLKDTAKDILKEYLIEGIQTGPMQGSTLEAGKGQATFTYDPFGDFVNDFTTGAVKSALTQGLNIATGDQDKFSWGQLVADGVLNSRALSGLNSNSMGENGKFSWGRVAINTFKGIARGVIHKAIKVAVDGKGSISLKDIAADAFGSALASEIAGSITNELRERENRKNMRKGDIVDQESTEEAGVVFDVAEFEIEIYPEFEFESNYELPEFDGVNPPSNFEETIEWGKTNDDMTQFRKEFDLNIHINELMHKRSKGLGFIPSEGYIEGADFIKWDGVPHHAPKYLPIDVTSKSIGGTNSVIGKSISDTKNEVLERKRDPYAAEVDIGVQVDEIFVEPLSIVEKLQNKGSLFEFSKFKDVDKDKDLYNDSGWENRQVNPANPYVPLGYDFIEDFGSKFGASFTEGPKGFYSDVTAVVITPKHSEGHAERVDNNTLENTNKWQQLSIKTNSPVIVSEINSKSLFIFYLDNIPVKVSKIDFITIPYSDPSELSKFRGYQIPVERKSLYEQLIKK